MGPRWTYEPLESPPRITADRDHVSDEPSSSSASISSLAVAPFSSMSSISASRSCSSSSSSSSSVSSVRSPSSSSSASSDGSSSSSSSSSSSPSSSAYFHRQSMGGKVYSKMTNIVLFFMLGEQLPYWHDEVEPAVPYFHDLRVAMDVSASLTVERELLHTISSNPSSSSLRSSISRTKSRAMFRRSRSCFHFGRGKGCGCGGLGSSAGKCGTRGISVGLTTDIFRCIKT